MEYSGQDGFCIDIYVYCDQEFMVNWNCCMLEEFLELGIFGEIWVYGFGVQFWFIIGLCNELYDSYLLGVIDF